MTMRPAPKPAKREKRERAWNSTLPRPKKLPSLPSLSSVSKKKEKGGEGRARPEPRRKPLARGTTIRKRNPKRRQSELMRAYGPPARREWIRSLPCEVEPCDTGARVEQAHTKGGGAGRKADACWIIPLCRTHHRELHSIGKVHFECRYAIDLDSTAENIEAHWQAGLAEGAFT